MSKKSDVLFADHGSVTILFTNTRAATTWVEEHLPPDRMTWGVTGTVIEPRYVDVILEALINDGLTVST